jgi:CheY-like chemotaxis protein
MMILVVDDDNMAGSVLVRTLRSMGHIVLLAGNAKEAMALYYEDVEAVISDLNMPETDGVEMVRALRRRRPDLPVAFCTGSELDGELAEQARALGTVIGKPWKRDEIEALLRGFRHTRDAP